MALASIDPGFGPNAFLGGCQNTGNSFIITTIAFSVIYELTPLEQTCAFILGILWGVWTGPGNPQTVRSERKLNIRMQCMLQ